MAARRMTRSLREHQSAYEDRARVFQERINTCREAYRDAKDALDGLRLVATDNPQRKSQLADRLYANILQLRAHSYANDAVMEEWSELIRTYNLQHEDSDWAASMRRQHDDYFAQLPALDERIKELLALYQERHDRVEDQLATPQRQARQSADEAHPEGSNNASSFTTTSNGANGETDARSSRLAHTADGTVLQRDSSGVSRMAHPAVENDLLGTPDDHIPDAGDDTSAAVTSTPRPRPIIREAPPEVDDEVRELSMRSEGEIDTDTEFHDAPTESHVRRTTARQEAEDERREVPIQQRLQPRDNAGPRREQPTLGRHTQHGVFAQGHGLFTDASPMAWQPKRPGTGRPQDSFFYSEAPPSSWTRHAWIREKAADRPKTPLSMASAYAAPTAPGSHAAHTAAGYREVGKQSRQASRPPSPIQGRTASYVSYKEHRDRLRQGLGRAPPAGGGHSSAPPPAPTPPPRPASTAWTKQPPDSTANVHSQPPPKVDHGVDFGRENASKFYQNAVYTRNISTSTQPLVLNQTAIEKFGGDIRSFPAFRNHFLEIVEGRKDMEPRYKLLYLLQCLTDEPLREAKEYMISDENYFVVLDSMEERYGNKTRLLHALDEALANLKPAGQTATDLRRFHNQARRLVDEMKVAGHDINVNFAWKKALITKLPPSLRLKIFEVLDGSPMDVPMATILSRLLTYVNKVEDSDIASPWKPANAATGNSSRNGPPSRPDPRSTPYRAGTYVADADATLAANKHEGRRRCAFCGRDHWSLKCNIYASVSQRVNRLRQLGFCFLCLRGGHWTGTCPKKMDEPCKYCRQGQHHQSLCLKAYRGNRQPFASLRRSPVRAPTTASGHPGVLKTEPPGGSSSHPQAVRFFTPVNPTGAPGAPPATSRPPSTQISLAPGADNSNSSRRKKSKGPRTGSKGRNGTTRPTTAYAAENVTQMDANACGSDGLLAAHQDHLTTDRRSTQAEARWNDWHPGVSTSGHPGVPDVPEGRVLSDEEASLPESTGHCSDVDSEPPAEEQYADDPSWFALNPDFQDYSGYAVSTSSPADNQAVLLECLRTTAVNINNGLTRSVIVFFDSGSNRTFISMKLARELRLPCLQKRYFRVNTFGTDALTSVTGFDTTVLLRSPQGATVALTLTASDRIVPPVTTATVKPDEIAMLQRNECSLISTRETPDLLVGQDLVHLFDRQCGPRLPSGFQVVWSSLGPMVGGAGMVAYRTTTAPATTVAAAPDPEPPGDNVTTPTSVAEETPPSVRNLGYNPDDPLNLWTLDFDDPAPSLAHTADSEAGATAQSLAHTADSGSGVQAVTDASTLLCSLLEKNDADLFGDFSHVENAGIGTTEMTPDDQAAADMLKNLRKRHADGRYEVPRLFRTPDGEPPSNDEHRSR